ncbi:putative calcium/proton exchanger, sodium/calcium exchanger membrane region [Dioscorea sansibarensis]
MASTATGHDHESRLLEEGDAANANIHNNKGGGSGGGGGGGLNKEMRHGHGRTAHNMSSSSLRKKSDLSLVSKVRCTVLRGFLSTLQEIFLGTKLFVLFPAVPLAIAAHYYHLGRAWVFALSLLGLTPLAERVSFLTEQIAFYTGPTVGGLLNATCGNATELIIALFALHRAKIEVVKWSLMGSILSNLLLVLGTSLFCGGLANLRKEQLFDPKQAEVNTGLLLLGSLCHTLPLMLRYAVSSDEQGAVAVPTLMLSRVCSVVMLIAYVAYLFFQLKTHRRLFEAQEEDETDDSVSEDAPALGFASALAWLIGMTVVIAVLSEYVVGTIEAASESWGISVSFISIILLPIVGNAAEHAGAIIFAFKNKLDITLGVSLGSATQISMFVVPLSVIVAWIMGIQMDLDFKILETGSLIIAILATSFTLQDGTSHYMKGFVLLLCYIVIGSCFFVLKTPSLNEANGVNSNSSVAPKGVISI